MRPVPDADIVLSWCRAGLDALAAAREEIDALNVFPIPDGDTGTNLYLTMESAVASADEAANGSMRDIVNAMARGALVGARGNSGVILAQMLNGVADVLGQPDVALADGRALAAALDRAADSAYRAVAQPVEGTILSVARAAADAARRRAGGEGPSLPDVALAAAHAARAAVEHTSEQLDVLRNAGVVDAGGRGLSVLLDTFDTVLTGRRSLPHARTVGQRLIPSPGRASLADRTGGAARRPESAPSYEVMYLLEASDGAVEQLRDDLMVMGESVTVVGDGGSSWNVHVHTANAGATIEAGIRAGHPHGISVTHLEPHRPITIVRALIAFAAGAGLADLFTSAGAHVVSTPIGYRPSTAEMLQAIHAAKANEIVILPNDRDVIPVAEAAAAEVRADGIRAAVIPSTAQVQGLAAAAVFEPGRAFDTDVVAMTTAAGHTRHGAVTVATREAVTMAGICHPGDVLGVIEGDFAVIGADLREVATDVIGRMMSAGGELVTVVTGQDAEPGLASAVADTVRELRPEADTVVYDGGQPRYPLLLGVE